VHAFAPRQSQRLRRKDRPEQRLAAGQRNTAAGQREDFRILTAKIYNLTCCKRFAHTGQGSGGTDGGAGKAEIAVLAMQHRHRARGGRCFIHMLKTLARAGGDATPAGLHAEQSCL
jgi:hypothetical protein